MNDSAFCPDCGCARRSETGACANCGRSLEPVAESLEPAGAPVSGWTQPANDGAIAVTSWPRLPQLLGSEGTRIGRPEHG
jgi:hypothetical protein